MILKQYCIIFLKFISYRKTVRIWLWSNYSDLTRPHPKWWFSKGNHLISGKSRLVKYYNLARWLYMTVKLEIVLNDRKAKAWQRHNSSVTLLKIFILRMFGEQSRSGLKQSSTALQQIGRLLLCSTDMMDTTDTTPRQKSCFFRPALMQNRQTYPKYKTLATIEKQNKQLKHSRGSMWLCPFLFHSRRLPPISSVGIRRWVFEPVDGHRSLSQFWLVNVGKTMVRRS